MQRQENSPCPLDSSWSHSDCPSCCFYDIPNAIQGSHRVGVLIVLTLGFHLTELFLLALLSRHSQFDNFKNEKTRLASHLRVWYADLNFLASTPGSRCANKASLFISLLYNKTLYYKFHLLFCWFRKPELSFASSVWWPTLINSSFMEYALKLYFFV